MPDKAPSFARMAIVLGLLAAVGPFAIDMYLPALPTIAADLGATTAATQMTLTAFIVPFGVCQLAYGPISDMVGRKPPLYFGLTVFLFGSIGCALAPNIDTLLMFRVIQGIGASAVMVIPRAVIRDIHTGIEAARLMSLVMLVFSVCPILAPLVGSALIVPFGWRAVFWAVVVATALGIVLLATHLPETRQKAQRVKASFGSIMGGFGLLLRDWHFLGLTYIGAFGMCSFFSFLASSSFIYIDHFGLTPTQYSLGFALNAVGFIGASQMSARLSARFGMVRLLLGAVTLYAVAAVATLAVTFFVDSLPVLMTMLFITFSFTGLVVPTTMVLALEDHGPIAGMASALGGTLQMVTGALMIVLVGVFFNGTALPMVAGIAGCAVSAAILTYLTLRRPRAAPAAAE